MRRDDPIRPGFVARDQKVQELVEFVLTHLDDPGLSHTRRHVIREALLDLLGTKHEALTKKVKITSP